MLDLEQFEAIFDSRRAKALAAMGRTAEIKELQGLLEKVREKRLDGIHLGQGYAFWTRDRYRDVISVATMAALASDIETAIERRVEMLEAEL